MVTVSIGELRLHPSELIGRVVAGERSRGGLKRGGRSGRNLHAHR